MNCQRGLWAGIFVFLILTGCSKDKTLNVEGVFSPVIVNLGSDNEPPVRGDVNALTVFVSNPRGYPLVYHWSTSAGSMTDTTAATAHWTPPDTIGIYPVTVSIQAHDDLNNVDFFKTRTFNVYVDNRYERWTRSIAIQFDVAPPAAGKLYYAELRNTATGESDIWALASPLGSPERITRDFWQATSPTPQSDGSRVVFLGSRRVSEIGPSIWQVPPTGGPFDTTTAALTVLQNNNTNRVLGSPRFAPTGSFLLYSSDSTGNNFGRPKPWMRDAANLNTQPIPITPVTADPAPNDENLNTYWNGNWNGQGDSIVVEGYSSFTVSGARTSRGLFKLAARGLPTDNPSPFPVWLNDLTASEPDWSPDGQHIVFSKRLPGRSDRDLFIINANASNPNAARPVTSGPADEHHPRFSSDGLKIFFISNRADGYGANGFYETERRGTNIWSVSRFDRP